MSFMNTNHMSLCALKSVLASVQLCALNALMFHIFTDTCYVLSFAIIMLNTSLHNPNVRDKPAVERFISMNRGINEGGDLPEELLRVLPFNINLHFCDC